MSRSPDDSYSDDERGFDTWVVRHPQVEPGEIKTVGAPYYQGMPLKSPGGRRAEQTKTGKYDVFLTYEGHPGDEGSNDPNRMNEEFEWLGSNSEEPIESHPRINELVANYSGYEAEEGEIKFHRFLIPSAEDVVGIFAGTGFGLAGLLTAVADIAGGVEENPMYGAEIYLARHRVGRWTFAATSYPEAIANLDGKIVEASDLPDVAPGEPREGRNYQVLVERTKFRGDGEVGAFDCEVLFIESEEGGFGPEYVILNG